MAVLVDENLEGGTNGATINTGNSAFNLATVGTPTFDNTLALSGTFGARLNPSAASHYFRHSAGTPSGLRATSGIRFYIQFAALPSVSVYVSTVTDGATTRAQLGVDATGTVRIRNNLALVATTTAAMSTDTWYRLEWVLDNGASTQQLRLFTGHDTSPLSGGDISGAYNTGTHEQVRFGVAASATWNYVGDDYKILDTADFPGPSVVASNWTYGYDVVIGG